MDASLRERQQFRPGRPLRNNNFISPRQLKEISLDYKPEQRAAQVPTGDSKKVVSTANMTTSAAAMSSNAELRLYCMSACGSTYYKTCM
ncbi:hypothetical protein DHEL01_v211242 [Diaporthe helianthi]|uniref:Uncharacterized protein n=1 Tax=Diaporthe helianthi TaxID=158607 RepID=A0A2P5HJD4_DIAHE|nr:hypothetical protein DHEL01_v211242 [Diaporthe helianthi]